jgi:hypothetical protein
MSVYEQEEEENEEVEEGRAVRLPYTHPHTCTHTHISNIPTQHYFGPHPQHLVNSLSVLKQHVIHITNMLNIELKHKPNMV